MRTQRALLPAVLLLASACVHRPPATDLAPELGPAGSIRVLYDGGLLNRRVSAHFTVERPSYVMVGHLAGDGVIRVVYPERAANTLLKPGTLYRTAAFAGDYDGAPSYYFMSVTRLRAMGARNYSYDGRGHAYVFMILSRKPFHLTEVSDFGLWNEFEVADYRLMSDPRLAVRKFADLVTEGVDYTLEYAHSFTTYAYTTYADNAWDCSMLAYGFGGMWSDLNGFAYGDRYAQRCGNYGYGYNYAFGYPFGYPYGYGYPNRPVFNVPVPQTPVTPVAQRSPRPTFIPTTPSDRRNAERRNAATTATAYRPTWADNPTFAPNPPERRTGSSPRRPAYDQPTRSGGTRWADDSRRGSSNPSGSSSTGSSSTGSSSTGSTTNSTPASAPAPTMSPGHGSSSGSGRRPPG